MSPALNYKALLYATPTHLPSICPFTRPQVIISALSMNLPPVLWAWIRAPATHFLGARILTTLPLSIPPAAFSALPQHLPSPFSVIILSSQYLFQRGLIWVHRNIPITAVRCCFSGPNALEFADDLAACPRCSFLNSPSLHLNIDAGLSLGASFKKMPM